MPQWRVYWEIDVEAGNPLQAARAALAIQRDRESTATVFDVALHGQCPSCKQHAIHKENCRLRQQHGLARNIGHHMTIDVVDKNDEVAHDVLLAAAAGKDHHNR